MATEVVMIRHAQSTWNAEGRFTGWANPPLNDKGKEEAVKAGRRLKAAGYHFDCVYTSYLQRAETTARIVLEVLGEGDLPVVREWRLNERHYGDLQGKSKQELKEAVGEEQVHRWRRGYADKPPALAADDPRQARFSELWRDLPEASLPSVESLEDTRNRALACWEEEILPRVKAGEKVLIAAHGNTLRGLIMALSGMSEKDVETFEIPTGVPIIYRFNDQGEPQSWEYLRD